jgi:predicted permease
LLALGIGLNKATPMVYDTEDEAANVAMLRIFACIFMSRFVISPLLMVLMLKCLARMGLVDESAMWLVLLLESCMPRAQNSVLMLQVADKGKEGSNMAKFLFFAYAESMSLVVGIVTLTLNSLSLI